MAHEIGEMRYLDWAGKVRVTWTMVGCVLFFISGVLSAALLAVQINRATTYPYTVTWRKLVGIDGDSQTLSRPTIPQAGDLTMQRLIEYHDLDCERWYERKAVSEVRTGKTPGYVQYFETRHEQRLPAEMSGRPQTWSSAMEPQFPCGDAFLVENITLSCSWLNEWFVKMHRPTVITAFRVGGGSC